MAAKDQLKYYTLPEVAQRLGLGKIRRARQNPGKQSVSGTEREARPVRKLIRDGDLTAIFNGCYLVREDWLAEYEDKREAKAIRQKKEAQETRVSGHRSATPRRRS